MSFTRRPGHRALTMLTEAEPASAHQLGQTFAHSPDSEDMINWRARTVLLNTLARLIAGL
jgi:hypothetical protein